MRMLARRLDEVISRLGLRAPDSLTGMSTADWCQHSAVAVQRRTGTLPTPSTARDFREQLWRCHRLLTAAYDTRPWWAREVWDPNLDPRIPQRPHEPRGRQGPLHPDRDRLAASRPAVVLQGGSGDRCPVLGNGPAAGERDRRLRCLPARPRSVRAMAGRRSGPGPGIDAGLPRSPARTTGRAARTWSGTVLVPFTGQLPPCRRRAVLRVHARPP